MFAVTSIWTWTTGPAIIPPTPPDMTVRRASHAVPFHKQYKEKFGRFHGKINNLLVVLLGCLVNFNLRKTS